MPFNPLCEGQRGQLAPREATQGQPPPEQGTSLVFCRLCLCHQEVRMCMATHGTLPSRILGWTRVSSPILFFLGAPTCSFRTSCIMPHGS